MKSYRVVCTAEHAGQLLDELRRAYQALAPEERQKVQAFINELSYTVDSDEGERDPFPGMRRGPAGTDNLEALATEKERGGRHSIVISCYLLSPRVSMQMANDLEKTASLRFSIRVFGCVFLSGRPSIIASQPKLYIRNRVVDHM